MWTSSLLPRKPSRRSLVKKSPLMWWASTRMPTRKLSINWLPSVIKFHGFQTDVHPFYEAADCVVLPSYHEGMSNVLLEGAATGRALITSDIPGCREAVEDGVSGYLCPAKDADALTNFFREFAGKTHVEQEQMGRCGRALIERKFDKRIVVAQTIAGLMLPVTART